MYINNLNAGCLTIEHSLIKKLTIINEGYLIRKINILSSEIEEIVLEGTGFEYIEISNVSDMKTLSIEIGCRDFFISNINIDNEMRINKIGIRCDKHLKFSKITISDLSVIELNVTGSNENRILIEKISVDRLHFNTFINSSYLTLTNIKINTSFRTLNSYLGKAEFFNVSFNEKLQMSFLGSSIGEIILINSIFPTHNDSYNEMNYAQKRELFKQLKFVSGKNGDKLNELIFIKEEFEVHRKSLNNWSDFKDKSILYLNKYSSDYGQNWIRGAAIVMTLTGPISFGLYCQSLGFDFGSNFITFFDLLSYYPEFLNPLHKADFIKDEITKAYNVNVSGWYLLCDNLSRIVNGYFIYQTIQAFRKFGKSSS